MKPRTKAPSAEQLAHQINGELAIYEQVGLPQRAVGRRTSYRYRGALLLYQQALAGRQPTPELSKQYLGHLRKQGFGEDNIYVHRAVLQGFHRWKGEQFVFAELLTGLARSVRYPRDPVVGSRIASALVMPSQPAMAQGYRSRRGNRSMLP